MSPEEIFYILGIVYMTAYLVVLVVAVVWMASFAKRIEEVRNNVNRVVSDIKGTVEDVRESKLLGLVPLTPLALLLLRFAGKKIGLRKK